MVAASSQLTGDRPNKRARVAVVGAGPAGLFASECLARAGHLVTIYDRMASPARKFLLAGRGGLNLTHSEALPDFARRYSDSTFVHDATRKAACNADGNAVQADRMRAALDAFPPSALIDWANGLGAETFVGSSGRVFPKAMKASPLLRAWLRRLDDMGVQFAMRETWTGFADTPTDTARSYDDRHPVTLTFQATDAVSGTETAHDVHADAVLLALGGASWPRLGSDGAWQAILNDVGAPIAPLEAANCGVDIEWSALLKDKFEGTALKRVAVTLTRDASNNGDAKPTSPVRGDVIITRRGLEGGAIYALGPIIRRHLALGRDCVLSLDLKPDVSEQALTAKLSRPRGAQSLSTFLRKTAGLDANAIALLREATLPDGAAALAARIKSVPLCVAAIAPIEKAISTAGGVQADNLTPQWMLKARPGVFVAGEMVDWEAPTGGYLLQGCFASALVSARGLNDWLADPGMRQSD